MLVAAHRIPKKGWQRATPFGFTLVELLVVLAILGILSAIAIGRYRIAVETAKQRVSMANVRNVGMIVSFYQLEQNKYPLCPGGDMGTWQICTVEDIKPILIPPSPEALLTNFAVKDGWGNDYIYESDGYNYIVRCYGKNGVPDGPISPTTRHNFDLDIYFENGTFTASPF